MKRVRVGIIGVSRRAWEMLSTIAAIDEMQVVMLCDLIKEKAEAGCKILQDAGYTDLPEITTDYHDLFNKDKLDAILIMTCWNEHIPLAIEFMEAGIPVGVEVCGANSIQQCWDLVKTYEKTRTPIMMLENCCYGRFEMAVLRMIREGLFGTVTHCEGGYQHFLGDWFAGGLGEDPYKTNPDTWYAKGLTDDSYDQRCWHNLKRNTELYPTHEIGPIAKYLNINRGNRFLTLSAFASKPASLREIAAANGRNIEFNEGDFITTMLKCANGETVMIAHDTTMPRPYSRGNVVHGTKGTCMEINKSIYIDGVSPFHKWESIEPYLEKYEHPVWKEFLASGVQGSHDGMDYLEMKAFAYSIANNVGFPMDVYDAATWMAITTLAEDSIAMGSQPVPVPDFTNGRWIHREPEPESPYKI